MQMYEYNNNRYNIIDLIIYHYDSNLPEYKTGTIKAIHSGNEFDIKDAFKIYQDEIKRMIDDCSSFSSAQQRQKIANIYNNKFKDLRIAEFQGKLDNDTITLDEIHQWIELLPYKEKSRFEICRYDEFFIINCEKQKPKGMSYTDYGRFMALLHFMDYHNRIAHNNGKPIKKKDLLEKLEFNGSKNLDRFFLMLRKLKIIVKTEKDINEISHIIVNPIYAMKKIEINPTIYHYFKEDIDAILTPLERKFLELKGCSVNSNELDIEYQE